MEFINVDGDCGDNLEQQKIYMDIVMKYTFNVVAKLIPTIL